MKMEKRTLFPYTAEGITPQNMWTLKIGKNVADIEALDHDVTLMNEGQLARYMRMAFLGRRDETFLPPTFWRDAFGGDKSTGKFFGELAGSVGRICYLYPYSADEDDQAWVGYPVHAEYRHNLRSALKNLLLQATWSFSPTKTQMELAVGVVETIEQIAIVEGYGQGFPDDTQNQPLFHSALTMIDAMHHVSALNALLNDPQSELSSGMQFLERSTYHR